MKGPGSFPLFNLMQIFRRISVTKCVGIYSSFYAPAAVNYPFLHSFCSRVDHFTFQRGVYSENVCKRNILKMAWEKRSKNRENLVKGHTRPQVQVRSVPKCLLRTVCKNKMGPYLKPDSFWALPERTSWPPLASWAFASVLPSAY
jgi:hypothetical protein